jgi:hypothetical protein
MLFLLGRRSLATHTTSERDRISTPTRRRQPTLTGTEMVLTSHGEPVLAGGRDALAAALR